MVVARKQVVMHPNKLKGLDKKIRWSCIASMSLTRSTIQSRWKAFASKLLAA